MNVPNNPPVNPPMNPTINPPGSAPVLIQVCASADLTDGGKGARFALRTRSGQASGFVVRYQGVVRGWLNQCAHVPMELDWQEGVFFDDSGLYLICATHGAMYEPDSGRCAGGPCRGGRLWPIAVIEQQGSIYWQPDDKLLAPVASEPAAPG